MINFSYYRLAIILFLTVTTSTYCSFNNFSETNLIKKFNEKLIDGKPIIDLKTDTIPFYKADFDTLNALAYSSKTSFLNYILFPEEFFTLTEKRWKDDAKLHTFENLVTNNEKITKYKDEYSYSEYSNKSHEPLIFVSIEYIRKRLLPNLYFGSPPGQQRGHGHRISETSPMQSYISGDYEGSSPLRSFIYDIKNQDTYVFYRKNTSELNSLYKLIAKKSTADIPILSEKSTLKRLLFLGLVMLLIHYRKPIYTIANYIRKKLVG